MLGQETGTNKSTAVIHWTLGFDHHLIDNDDDDDSGFG